MNITKLFNLLLIICVLGGLSYFIVIKASASSKGDTAPNFKTTLINGSDFELVDLKGQYVLLDFWASWCAPCRKEIPEMIQFYSDYKEKITIVSIALEKNASVLKNNPETFNFPWNHQIIQESSFVMLSEIAQMYGISEIPTKILIGPDGKIMSENQLTEIKELLLNKK